MSTPPDDYGVYDNPPFPLGFTVDLTKEKYPEDSQIGLGRHALLPYSYWAFIRWTGWVSGDYYGLRIKDLTRPIASGNALKDEDRYIAAFEGDLIEDGDHPYFGRLLRVGTNQEDRSITQSVLFKKEQPAGDDPEPDKPWHGHLLAWIEGLPEGSVVTQDIIDNGLRVWVQPYPRIRKNDRNIFKFGGRPYTYIVSPTDASGNIPYVVEIPGESIDVTEYGGFTMRMGVVDVVGNEVPGKYKLSKPYALFSDRVRGRLEQPWLTLYDDQLSEIDLDVKPAADYIVYVYPRKKPKPVPNPRYRVVLFMVITRADNTSETVSFPPVTDRNLGTESITVSHDAMNELGPGTVRYYYEWQNSIGDVIETSTSNTVYVIGEQTQYPPMDLSPFQLGLIPRDTDLETKFPIYKPFVLNRLATVTLRAAGNNNGATVITSKQLVREERAVRLFGKKALKALESENEFDVFYDIDAGNGKPARQSEVVKARIGDGVADLPAAFIKELEPHHGYLNLDPNVLNGYGLNMFFLTSVAEEGDELHYRVTGKSPKSSVQGVIKITKALAGLALQKLETVIDDRIFLENTGSSIDIAFSIVTLGAEPVIRRSEVLRFSIGEPVDLVSLKLLEANAADGTITPLAVTKGATLEMVYTPALKGDSVTFTCNGEFGLLQHMEVMEANPKAKTFKSLISPSVLSRALRQNGNNLVISCVITRGPFKYQFETLRLRLLPLELPELYVNGQKDTSVLPLHQMTAVDIIISKWEFASALQYLWLSVSGELANGETFTDSLAVARQIDGAEATSGLSISWPLARARQVKDGSTITLSGSVSLPGIPLEQTTTQFKLRSYTAALLPSTLNFPVLHGAPATQAVAIDPVTFEFNINFAVTIAGMLATDVVLMTVTTQSGASFQMSAAGNASGKVLFNFTPRKIIHNCVGGWMQARYTLTRNGKVTPSSALTVYVSAIPIARNPVATINNQSPQTTLDLNRIVGSTSYSMPKWPMVKTGQTIWVDFAVSGRTIPILAGYAIPPVVEANGIAGFGFPRSALTAAPKGTWGYLQIYLAYDGSPNRARAVLVSQTPYIVNDSFVPVNVSFVHGAGQWSFGPGASGAYFTPTGLYVGTDRNDNSFSGAVISTVVDLAVGHMYSFSFVVLNNTPHLAHLFDPVLDVYVGGRLMHTALRLPKWTWAYLNASFVVTATGPTIIVLRNNSSSGLGNDFYIHAAAVNRLT
ncbi:hypothetical protein [Pseudomonas tolaasii]|uniref:hypothetical protein n=1 Tax=Pseudomonas tolaasii TaxID=29442 RepID=UPI000305CC92|nr:hypothetical protein [Pseudomonas tolaasii]